MRTKIRSRRLTVAWILVVAIFASTTASGDGPAAAKESDKAADWPQWGGPGRDFTVDTTGLASSWPESGPKKLWSRPLGEGYSAIAVAGGRLFTMYRDGDREIAIAMKAVNGKTVWERGWEAPFTDEYNLQYGPGPNSTPLVVGGRVFVSGSTAKFHCLDAKTGEVLWSHDLQTDFGANLRPRGYGSSPMAYGNTVIVFVGGEGHGVVAFKQADGSVVWKSLDLLNSDSSPILIEVDGQEQLVAFMQGAVAGLDPASGELLWSHPHETQYGLNISTPVWGDDNLLFVSSAYSGGSRMLRLNRKDGKTVPEELWFTRRMRIHFGNAVRIGDRVYGSSGDFGPALFGALDVETGKPAWRDRGLAKASFVHADGKFIIIDEDGHLTLATPGDDGLEVHSKVELMDGVSWTVPTLVGKTLYVRDRKTVVALDLR